MNYRPITDVWILARPKVKYYGAYPSGFLERARALLAVCGDEPVLHVCGGMAGKYPFRGFGPNDKTLDLDPAMEPDFLQDARLPLPLCPTDPPSHPEWAVKWPAILIDPPYTEQDANHYVPGESKMPTAGMLLRNALDVVRPGGRVGMLHYIWPRPPKSARLVAAVAVLIGYDNRIRCYSVFERSGSEV